MERNEEKKSRLCTWQKFLRNIWPVYKVKCSNQMSFYLLSKLPPPLWILVQLTWGQNFSLSSNFFPLLYSPLHGQERAQTDFLSFLLFQEHACQEHECSPKPSFFTCSLFSMDERREKSTNYEYSRDNMRKCWLRKYQYDKWLNSRCESGVLRPNSNG